MTESLSYSTMLFVYFCHWNCLFVLFVNVFMLCSTLHPVQLLIRSGRAPEESLMLLVPEAYKNHPTLSIKYPEVLCFLDVLCSL